MSPYRLGITRTSNWVGSWTIWKTQASGHVRKVRKRIRATGKKQNKKWEHLSFFSRIFQNSGKAKKEKNHTFVVCCQVIVVVSINPLRLFFVNLNYSILP